MIKRTPSPRMLLLMVLASSAFMTSRAQNCSNSGSDWLNKYRKPGIWTPTPSTPVKTILVNFIVCQKSDGTGGWIDSPLFRNELAILYDSINQVYSHSKVKGYTTPCMPFFKHITDTKIRFELNEVIFIQNDAFHYSASANTIMDYVYTNYPNARKGMNHIFTMPTSGTNGEMGVYSINFSATYGLHSYVQTYGQMWSDYTLAYPELTGHLVHEYGHAVGLGHIYDGEVKQISHFDFLDDVFGSCAVPSNPCTRPAYCTPVLGYVCNLDSCYFGAGPAPFMSNGANANYISPKAMGRMHRALSLFDNNFVMYNLPMHQYVKEKTPYSAPMNITTSEIWDFAIKLYQNIVVKSGNTLTIQCEVRMPIGGKIIVEPGARLVIDGGKITSAHDELWAGIEVQGAATSQQALVSGAYPQGYVELQNGAIIENATIGVKCIDGGIINANASTFRNNAQAVSFSYFTNTNTTGAIISNISQFNNCNFLTTSMLLGNQPFTNFIYATGVWLNKFKGNIFENTRTGTSTSAELGTGIYSLYSSINVTSSCSSTIYPCPEANIIWNEFRNLNIGVRISDVTPTSVVENKFIDCAYGILSESSYEVTIQNNRIWVGTCKSTTAQRECGIMLNGDAYGVNVKNNRIIQSIGSNALETVGIVVRGTGANNNTVTQNTLTDLTYGNLSVNVNRSINTSTGLLYTCNTNINTVNDFYVSYETSGLYSNSGIRYYQGSSTSSAGNIFTADGPGAETDFQNPTYNSIYYYWDSGTKKKPVYYTSGRVTLPALATIAVNCNPGGGLSGKAQQTALFETVDKTHTSLLQLYRELTDTSVATKLSNTEILAKLDELRLEVPDLLRDQLVSVETDGTQIVDQLLADATLGRDLLIRDIVSDLYSNDGALDAANISFWESKRNNPYTELNVIATGLLHDTLYPLWDEQLASLTSRYVLEDIQREDVLSFKAFYNEVKSWILSGKKLKALSEKEITWLKTEADKTANHKSILLARNLLNAYYGGEYVPAIRFVTESEQQSTNSFLGAVPSADKVSVFPNPASETVNITWTQRSNEKLTLQVTDINGRITGTYCKLLGNHFILDVKSLPEGIYFCQLSSSLRETPIEFKIVVKH